MSNLNFLRKKLATKAPFHGKSFSLASLPAFWLFIASLILILAGCGNNSSAYDPQVEYTKACADAALATPAKISKSLTAITPDNPNLIWENGVVGSRVLVVSWVDQNACNIYKCPPEGCQSTDTCKEGKECQYARDTYVTVVPELKNFFKTTSLTSMRIAQLLGLPPSDAQDKACFLEMWVSPRDLFRPSPDPEITDHEAELGFPGAAYSTAFRNYNTTELVYADQAYDAAQCSAPDQWGNCGFTDYQGYINNRKKYLYKSSKPYPWTALGYTYDWGNPDNHVGLSEFVVHGKKADGTKISVGIKAVTATANYFP